MKKPKNTIRIENDICYIDIFNIENKKICECLIDANQYKKIENYRWGSTFDGFNRYINTKIDSIPITLHVFLLGKKKGFVIDHINRNSLDNRLSNLRFATQSENVLNSNRVRKNKKYKAIPGVWFDKTNKKWIAMSNFENGKRKYLKVSPIKKDVEKSRIIYNQSLTKTSH